MEKFKTLFWKAAQRLVTFNCSWRQRRKGWLSVSSGEVSQSVWTANTRKAWKQVMYMYFDQNRLSTQTVTYQIVVSASACLAGVSFLQSQRRKQFQCSVSLWSIISKLLHQYVFNGRIVRSKWLLGCVFKSDPENRKLFFLCFQELLESVDEI